MSDRAARLQHLKALQIAYRPNGFLRPIERCTLLDAGSKSLTSLPPGVFDLGRLVVLGLYRNRLSQLPNELSLLSGVKRLFAHYNRLTAMDSGIFRVTSLTLLDVTYNRISQIPGEISRLSNLEYLGVSGNCILSLPDEIGALTRLTELYLYKNRVSCLPDRISALKKLSLLNARENDLSSLSNSISSLKRLSTLDIVCNPISVLPQAITLLNNLREILMSPTEENSSIRVHQTFRAVRNLLIRNDFKTAMNLEYYDEVAAYEKIENVSNRLGLWRKCSSVDISGNSISTLPSSFSTLHGLTKLCLANNRLSHIPDCILKMEWLLSLDISLNKITYFDGR